MTSPSDNALAPLAPASSDGPPEPGELKIKERRSWKTWQLLTAVLIAAIFGMWINGDTGGGASSTTGTSSGSGKLPPPSAASSGSAAGGSTATTTTAAGGSSVTTTTAASGSTTTTCRRRIHDDVNHIVDIVDDRRRTRTRPPDLATAPRQLDQHVVHDDSRPMEHRLGIQLRPCPSHRSIVPGVRDSGRVASHWNARDQRDRTVGTVGHGAVQPRGADARGASPGRLYLDRQGDRLVSLTRQATNVRRNGRPTPGWVTKDGAPNDGHPGGVEADYDSPSARKRRVQGLWFIVLGVFAVLAVCISSRPPSLPTHRFVPFDSQRAQRAAWDALDQSSGQF